MAEIDCTSSISPQFEKLTATELMNKKEAIEMEIESLLQVLGSQGGVGMSEPLMDSDMFPRSDIDLYTVRQSRQRVNCLRNDHIVVMKCIETKLHQIHAEARENFSQEKVSKISENSTEVGFGTENLHDLVFAKIVLVSSNSPAQDAGLKNGDLIIAFGSVNKRNFTDISDIAGIVKHSQGSNVELVIIRNNLKTRLLLKPKKWSGRGLLGCQINPI